MIARLIESKIRKALDRKKIVTVLGPRQAGKSTLAGVVAKAEADRILELNGDDSDVRTMFEDTDETRIRTLIGNHDFLPDANLNSGSPPCPSRKWSAIRTCLKNADSSLTE